MVHTDKIVRDLEVSYRGVFDFNEFLVMLRDFFNRYDYGIDEKVYTATKKKDLKNTKIEWDCDRKLDDYNHAHIKLGIGLNDYKESSVDGAKVVDGNLLIKINVIVERDYNEQWKTSPSRKFLRALYDKYVSAAKQNKVDASVKNVVDNLKKEIKQYLKT